MLSEQEGPPPPPPLQLQRRKVKKEEGGGGGGENGGAKEEGGGRGGGGGGPPHDVIRTESGELSYILSYVRITFTLFHYYSLPDPSPKKSLNVSFNLSYSLASSAFELQHQARLSSYDWRSWLSSSTKLLKCVGSLRGDLACRPFQRTPSWFEWWPCTSSHSSCTLLWARRAHWWVLANLWADHQTLFSVLFTRRTGKPDRSGDFMWGRVLCQGWSCCAW